MIVEVRRKAKSLMDWANDEGYAIVEERLILAYPYLCQAEIILREMLGAPIPDEIVEPASREVSAWRRPRKKR